MSSTRDPTAAVRLNDSFTRQPISYETTASLKSNLQIEQPWNEGTMPPWVA